MSYKIPSKRKKKGYLSHVQRLDHRQAMHDPGSQRVPPRRSFVHTTIIACLSSVSLAVGGIKILGMEAQLDTHKDAATYQLSIDQIATIIKEKMNITLSEESRMRSFVTTQEVEKAKESEILEVVHQKICDESNAFCRDPISGMQKGYNTASSALDWLIHYRLSADEIQEIDPEKIDCNDNSACEILSNYGLPMYIIAIYPKNPKDRFDHSWHQFAACKLNEDVFLIIDGKISVIWYGNLQQYVDENGTGSTPSEIIPVVGISQYAEPYFHNFISKGLVQIKHRIPSEEEMPPYYQLNQDSLADSK